MQSEEEKQQVKTITMQALSRLEKLKLDSSQTTPSTSKKADKKSLLNELDNLPPPPSTQPKKSVSATRASTMPRGTVYICTSM